MGETTTKGEKGGKKEWEHNGVHCVSVLLANVDVQTVRKVDDNEGGDTTHNSGRPHLTQQQDTP